MISVPFLVIDGVVLRGVSFYPAVVRKQSEMKLSSHKLFNIHPTLIFIS